MNKTGFPNSRTMQARPGAQSDSSRLRRTHRPRPIRAALMLGVAVSWLAGFQPVSGVVVHEIHYHPVSEDSREEFIELFNPTGAPVNVSGWRIANAVAVPLPLTTIPAGGYLVVAADPVRFLEVHPEVPVGIVAGPWVGELNNRGETIDLLDHLGNRVDRVRYADEGDWSVRRVGAPDFGWTGWEWDSPHDGGGKTLELIDPAMPNDLGQNWASSVPVGGTPGLSNSTSQSGIAPLLSEVRHFPALPTPDRSVRVSARVIDEAIESVVVELFYRTESNADFVSLPMTDDGSGVDLLGGDGIHSSGIPPFPASTVVEFFVKATDQTGASRHWPALTQPDALPLANLQYLVVDAPPPVETPHIRLIMTPKERADFLAMVDAKRENAGKFSDAQMNATFIASFDGKTEVRYRCGVRNRGNGSRFRAPNNYRVNFSSDDLWQGADRINLNAQFPYLQSIGAAVSTVAGFPMARTELVRVFLNDENRAVDAHPMYGGYVYVEVINRDYRADRFDGDVNIYRGIRFSGDLEADFQYLGEDPDPYRKLYFKETNESEDDWSDLIELNRVLGETPDELYSDAVRGVVDVEQWMRYFALNAFFDNRETSLGNGFGDDYILYRELDSPRFKLVPYDLDTILGEGDTRGDPAADLWKATRNPIIDRFLKWPEFAPVYFNAFVELTESTLTGDRIGALVDQRIGDRIPKTVRDRIIRFVDDRREFVRSRIPRSLTATLDLPFVNGVYFAESTPVTLNGNADPIRTRSVFVNGEAAEWSAWETSWTAVDVALQPGFNRLRVRAAGADGDPIDEVDLIVLLNPGPAAETVSGTLTENTEWNRRDNPYWIVSDLTVPSGVTLNVGPGANLFFGQDARLIVDGTLRILGTDDAPVHVSAAPGVDRWAGLEWRQSRTDNRLEHVVIQSEAVTADAVLTATDSDLTLRHATFLPGATRFLVFHDAALNAEHCVFGEAFEADQIVGGTVSPDRTVRLAWNEFRRVTGDGHRNVSVSRASGPGQWVSLIGNRFEHGGYQAAAFRNVMPFLKGNRFHRYRGEGAAAVFSEWTDPGAESPVGAMVQNVFYDCIEAVSASGSGEFVLHNNTFDRIWATAVRAVRDETAPPLIVSAIHNVFSFAPTTARVADVFAGGESVEWRVSHCLFPPGRFVDGTGNVEGFARFRMPGADWSLQPGSPGAGMGRYGLDLGAVIESPVAMRQPPISPTPDRSFGTELWSPGFTRYRFSLDGGMESDPVPIAELLELSGLQPGAHRIRIRFQDFTGLWQAPDEAFVFDWTVDPDASPVLIHEVMAQNAGVPVAENQFPDWIELVNRTDSSIDLAGWRLSDDPDNRLKFVFQSGAHLPPFGFLTVIASALPAPGRIHVGFSLAQEGEGVYLSRSDGSAADEVVFGFQLPDRSIGRNPTGRWELNVPTPDAPNVPSAFGDPRALRVNEWVAATSRSTPDAVEIYNPDSLPVNLGGMTLSDGPHTRPGRFRFPPNSYLDAGSFLSLESGVVLPFGLSAAGGTIGLRTVSGSAVDIVPYGWQRFHTSEGRFPDGGLPVHAFFQPTLGAANPAPESTGPEPPTMLISLEDEWFYDESGEDLGSAWRAPAFDVEGWALGKALFYAETAPLPGDKNTPLTLGPITYYFRKSFTVPDPTRFKRMEFYLIVDDGAVLYLNNEELRRQRMPPGDVHYRTLAEHVIDTALTGPFIIPIDRVAAGENILSVEVHQSAETSSDAVFGLSLFGIPVDPERAIRISEVLVDNRSFAEGPARFPAWVEVANPHPVPMDLRDFGLSDRLDAPARWVFPDTDPLQPSAFRRVLLDPSSGASADNAGFGLDDGGDALYLFQRRDGQWTLVDGVRFGFQAPDISIGRLDVRGGPFAPCLPTPLDSNLLVESGGFGFVRINEWLASNPTGPDGFELFNGGMTPVDLGGCSLTDDPTTPLKHILPPLSILGDRPLAHRWLFADGSPELGSTHIAFRLSAGGESITLFDPDGGVIDSVLFGPQSQGISEGRLPDGSAAFRAFPNSLTPGTPNHGDRDRDQLPDAWELAWNMDPDVANPPGQDSDLDGSSDLAEFLAGTNPLDETDHLALSAIQTSGIVELLFETRPGVGYALESGNMEVTGVAWTTILEIKPANNRQSIRYPLAPGSETGIRVFRIRLLPGP